ncbi:hypothetical protein K3G39_10520 [Pontibacter sp. HSC-14F20]|uniref:hypothetical protein n=1 Tax=Pontibacter sp. HSC-14F20 TaxID=2864136 RepID=UPI001C73B9EB|nr:hypothetical protein [Pontibacter sp. HSC-14F20]MBX0333671.1 hypothetical protein [Pontibacter sp. HSC-14F20]
MKEDLTILAYSIYLPIGVFVTYWVGKNLYKNGRLYLQQIFQQNEQLIDPLNKVLLTGYYLLNVGYVFVLMVQQLPIYTYEQLIEVLSSRVGIILVSLGGIHLFNLTVLYLISRKNQITNKL